MTSSSTPSPQPHVPPAGVWCPAVTFFNRANDTLSLSAQSRYFEYLSKTGLAGLVILGTNSEAFLLTREERAELIVTARAAVGPDFPLMAGVGAHSTKQTLELARDAAEAGADYVLVLPPAYFGKATSMTVVKRFFSEVAAKSPIPVVLYNFPGVCNGVDIDSDTITAVVRESAATNPKGRSNVVGVKLTCGSVGKITRLATTFKPHEFAIFGGQSDFLVGGLAAGSAGCIAAFANVFPRAVSHIYTQYQQGHLGEAWRVQGQAALAESAIKSGIAATKYAVAYWTAPGAGIADGEGLLHPRHPYQPVAEPVKEMIRTTMATVADTERELRKISERSPIEKEPF
ncbi:4-hydroxy-2-oxoglutarate aldolase [Penicillium ucsense]|uniref:4-hydroxy-2-oxoglutarate aldolase n=1 Tax=Penicillium ucsense TaxID=2839758 RepID=A0A8J8W0K3_9EURO|nr:4-hydroxy-2-oxoglutarate aldolase [Penicillium ucsense]KAF7739152.1 4-hydroxy-2-oxoglutarate aldolase [Penicillium ucsense]